MLIYHLWKLLLYTDIYKDYQVSITTKREHIIRYILLLYKDQVKAIPKYYANSFNNYNKAKFCIALKRSIKSTTKKPVKLAITF
jgi:hypothetical protein